MRAWLKNKREAKQLTQEEVAKSIGIAQTSYSSIETGVRRPSVEVAKEIAKLLSFEWTDFYQGEE